ncbi:MAG: hypothetical protein COX51_06420 [Syntrophobacteraceae bacterium CG23_combo_of_CG06-09_8_20_14_all_50_8]|nr:MAG: hypothetical protein COX51_06420 [Syntrophobacteraceae bacterium CG23_combo_of_CG06-09_8_20_14_all_50_8]
MYTTGKKNPKQDWLAPVYWWNMKKSLKAALISGFVFPGLGQIYLKRYLRGLSIILVSVSALSVIIGMVTMSALKNIAELQKQGPVDMAAASDLLASSSANHAAYYYICLLLIVCCWLFSAIDAYRIGKKIEPAA